MKNYWCLVSVYLGRQLDSGDHWSVISQIHLPGLKLYTCGRSKNDPTVTVLWGNKGGSYGRGSYVAVTRSNGEHVNNGVPRWGERGWCCRSSFIRTGQRFFINRRAKSGTEGFSWWRRCFRSPPGRHSCQSSPAVDLIGWSWPVTDGYRQMVCPITFQVFFFIYLFFFLAFPLPNSF